MDTGSPLPLRAESGLPPLGADGLLGLYREMLMIRRLEEQAAKAYTLRKILGFCHLYIGQEAVAVGAASATRDDYWIAAYREHGHALAKGASARAIMASLSLALTWMKSSGRKFSSISHCGNRNASCGASPDSGCTESMPPGCRKIAKSCVAPNAASLTRSVSESG